MCNLSQVNHEQNNTKKHFVQKEQAEKEESWFKI